MEINVIGVISDTHGRLDVRAYNALADVDHIVHAGDIGGPHILRELETLAPVTAVLGNNDFAEYGDSVGSFAMPVLFGVRFLVAHYPEDVRLSGFSRGPVAPGGPLPEVCVHGHTHKPRLDYGKPVRPAGYVLNPGSASRPRGGNPPSVARVVVGDGAVRAIRIESLDGDVLMAVGKMPDADQR